MSKDKKEKIDKNVQEFFEEIEAQAQQKKDEQNRNVEYVVCRKCAQKEPKSNKRCSKCGASLKVYNYTPISEKKAKIIRWTLGVIMVIAFFLIWFLVIDK